LRCITDLAESRSAWAIPWQCIHEFLGVVTHPKIYRPPTSLSVALEAVDAWLRAPAVVLLAESDGYWSELQRLVAVGQIVGPRIHDAHIAALCRHHGVRELWSADRDFGRFADLTVMNPLIG
jgi:predicted nucleic acid-binding protein